jgi:hypothetical protein
MAFAPWDRDRFLELWRQLFPPEYTAPIEAELDGEGLDTIAAFAALFARVDGAVNYTTQRYYLKPHSLQTGDPAAGGAKAVGSVDLTRTAPVDQAMTLVAGTLLLATYRDTFGVTQDGPAYVLAEDAVFAAGVLGPVTVTVEASRTGFAKNLEAGSITLFQAFGTAEIQSATVTAPLTTVANLGTRDKLDAGMVGRFLLFDTGPNAGTLARIDGVNQPGQTAELDRPVLAGVGDARVMELVDLGLSVAQPTSLAGGTDPWLDAIGADRRVFRVAGELDDPYRDRVCELPDTISPAAINRIARRILDPLGIRFVVKETRDPALWPGFVWDVDPFDVLGDFQGYVGGCEIVTAFVICVSGDNGLGDFGLTYDVASTPVLTAWDMAAWDGESTGWSAGLKALWDAVNAARAAGVCFTIALDPAL